MKIYVACDLEGVAGVVDHRQQCSWDISKGWFARYYEQARRLATLELNALVEGALEGGATEIVAWDGHGKFPGGLDVELLHPECKLVMSAGDGGLQGLDDSFNALYQLGMHSRAGTRKAVLSHSFWEEITGYWVNGSPVGEIWLNYYTAAVQGVPFVFISGDRAAAEEALELVPEIETAVVKEGMLPVAAGLSAAPVISLAPQKARSVIHEAARRAMGKAAALRPACFEPPFVVRVQFSQTRLADRVVARPGAVRIDATTVEVACAEQPWVLL